jgi:pantothenate kinase
MMPYICIEIEYVANIKWMNSINQKGSSSLIILLLIILVAAGGGGYYYYNTQYKKSENKSQNDNTVVTTTTETATHESPFANLRIKAEVTKTEDCGTQDCFEEKFAACAASKLTAESDLGSIYYEILEPTTTGCSVKMKYTQNPNPEWENKEMICEMDNSVAFEKAVEQTFDKVMSKEIVCQGPLYTILTNF